MADNTPAAPEGAAPENKPEQAAAQGVEEQIKALEKRLAALEEENARLKAEAQATP